MGADVSAKPLFFMNTFTSACGVCSVLAGTTRYQCRTVGGATAHDTVPSTHCAIYSNDDIILCWCGHAHWEELSTRDGDHSASACTSN